MLIQKATLILACLLVGVSSGRLPARACSTCAPSIQLSKKQLLCLEQFLPAYLAEATDPVIVSLLSCSQQSAIGASTNATSDPVLKPIVDPNGDNQASEKVFFLTKKQIKCLRDRLDDLKRQDGQQIKFEFNSCEG
jgi:hypothetical protein